jgi:hypothetical protein
LGVLTPLVVVDLTRGVGRYNFALGAVTTAQGIGASLSDLVAGVIVDRLGYDAGFVERGVAAMTALAVLFAFVPESRRGAAAANSRTPGNFAAAHPPS